MGMESGSPTVLDRMIKGTSLEKSIRACKLVMEGGVKLNTGWIVGYPGETPETVKETVDVILKIKPTTANIGSLIPYPGTAVYDEAKANGTLVGDWSVNNDTIPWVKLPWTKSYADLQAMTQWAKNKVYFRPYYMYNFAKEIINSRNIWLAKYTLQEAAKSIKKVLVK